MRTVRFFGTLGLLLAASSCGGRASVKHSVTPPCETRVSALHPADTLTVAVFDKIDLTHAPWPQNREERFVFGHLYETLVTVDCYGRAQPGLAKSWKLASDGIYIELQEDAHFWDDTMVTTDDVKASFEPAIRAGAAILSVDVEDETHAIIHGLKNPVDIRLLAQPLFSITKISESGPPIGTGLWEIARGKDVAIRPAGLDKPVVRFVQEDSRTTMDLVSGTADALITDNAAAIDYASRSKSATVPLAWDTAYFVMSPTLAPLTLLPRSVCDELAKNVVPVDAKGISPLINASPPCGTNAWRTATRRSGSSLSARVLYMSNNETSRALAERLAALASMDTASSADARAVAHSVPALKPGIRAVGLSKLEFEEALRQGNDAAYVVALSWCHDFPLTSCWLAQHAPWSVPYDGDSLGHSAVDLVETRAHLIVTSDRLGFGYDLVGHVRLLGPGAERVR